MNNLNKSLIALGLLALLGLGFVVGQSTNLVEPNTLGGAPSGPVYGSATNTVVSCGSTTSTLIVGASQARINFQATNNGATSSVTICKSASCVSGSGNRLNAAGGFYQQDLPADNYTGSYSCIGDTSTSSLGVIYSQ